MSNASLSSEHTHLGQVLDAELLKVFGCLGNRLAEQTNLDVANSFAANSERESDLK